MSHAVYQTPTPAKHQKTTVKVTLWVKPAVKAELTRLAGMDGLTVSKTGATFLEEAIHQKLHIQHAVLGGDAGCLKHNPQQFFAALGGHLLRKRHSLFGELVNNVFSVFVHLT